MGPSRRVRPAHKTGEWWRHEETSGGDPGDGGDPDSADSGVKTLLSEEEPSLKGERGCLVPLLSSIAPKGRKREETPKTKKCEMAINARRRRYI
jgi:hypothetical protein